MAQYRITGTLVFKDGSPQSDFEILEVATGPNAALDQALALARKQSNVESVINVECTLHQEQD